MTDPRVNSLVKFDKDDCPEGHWEDYYKDVFEDKVFIYLGEIPNMKWHCSLIERGTGKLLVGYHTDDFIELTEDDVSNDNI